MTVTAAEPTSERTRRRWPRRVLVGLVVAVVLVALIAALLLTWSIRRPWPQTSGVIEVAGLDGPVEVARDGLGVPSITATTTADLWRAQGFVHAQDRFFQMDAWRHITAGRTAELFGAEQLDNDRFLRTLGWDRIAAAELELIDAETRAMLAAYAEGVNAYIGERSARELGFEYTVLGLSGGRYDPEPWEPVHSLAFGKLMAWDLRTNLNLELERAVLRQTLSDEQVADLFPPYPDDAPVIVPDTGHPTTEPDLDVAGLPGVDAALAEALERVESISDLAGPISEGIGSNAWVVDGERTDTGAPILAGDTHLGIQMPSIWHQISLRCAADADDCDHGVAGFGFASAPGVVVGHNGRIAWGITNLGADVVDLVVERVNPDDADQVEVDGEWVEMAISEHTLRTADGTTETVTVRETPNGPLISDVYGPLDALDEAAAVGGEEEGSYAVALRWAALEPGTTSQALRKLGTADDWESFRDALADWAEPAQNFVYADVDGHIGYQAPGRLPIRDGFDGSVPVAGWDPDYDWDGFVPFDDLPNEFDPDRGWIVTANNAVVGDDYPEQLSVDWDRGYRATRIVELIEQSTELGLDDVQDHQFDTRDPLAETLVPALLDVDTADDDAQLAQDLLADWDGHADVDSTGAAVANATWRAVLTDVFAPRLPEDYPPAGNARWIATVDRLLDEPDADWWDAPASAQTETRDDRLAAALAAAVDELSETLGDDPAGWSWGALHTATFRHQTLGESGIDVIENRFNRGPYETAGGSAIVNATGWHATAGYNVTAVPSQRLLVDLADPDRTRAIHTTGQSGHAYHPHYTSMIEPWRTGEQHPLPWSPAAVAGVVDELLQLRPARD